jgi:hypothetical protein
MSTNRLPYIISFVKESSRGRHQLSPWWFLAPYLGQPILQGHCNVWSSQTVQQGQTVQLLFVRQLLPNYTGMRTLNVAVTNLREQPTSLDLSPFPENI